MGLVAVYLADRGDKGATGFNAVNADDVGLLELDNPTLRLFGIGKVADTVRGALTYSARDDVIWAANFYSDGDVFNLPTEIRNEVHFSGSSMFAINKLAASGPVADTDPFGGNEAWEFTLTANTDSNDPVLNFETDGGLPNNRTWIWSIWIKSNSGTVTEAAIFTDGQARVIAPVVDGTWRQYFLAIDYAGSVGSTNFFGVKGPSGGTFSLYRNQLYNYPIEPPVFVQNGAGANGVPNPEYLPILKTALGYPFEPASQSISGPSENFSGFTVETANAAIFETSKTAPSGIDPASYQGEQANYIQATQGGDIILSRATSGPVTASGTYFCSLYFLRNSGLYDGVEFALGDGAFFPVTGLPPNNNDYFRLVSEVTAGTGDVLKIKFVNPQAGFTAFLWGLACEPERLTSYIPSSTDPSTRSGLNACKVPHTPNVPRPNDEWSIFLRLPQGVQDAGTAKRFLWASDSEDFECCITGLVATVTNGTMQVQIDVSEAVFLLSTFDGTTLTVYSGLGVSESTSTGTPAQESGTDFFIGNKDDDEYLNTTMLDFVVWASVITQNQLLTLIGR